MNYQRIYDSIINRAKSEGRVKSKDTYYEAHHIVPVCLGGEGDTGRWRTHPNIVLLTGREHFLCHWLLHSMRPENQKLTKAFVMMCNVKDKVQQRYVPSSRVIEYARMLHIQCSRGSAGYWKGKHLTEEAKEKLRKCNIGRTHTEDTKKKLRQRSTGRTHTEESIKKMSESKKGVKFTDDHREKLKQAKLGNSHSQETRNKMSKTKLGKKRALIKCPHCNKIGGNNVMKQWHFDNCKKKKTDS